MATEVSKWESKPISFESVYLHADNIEDVAKWVGADFVHIFKNIHTGKAKVVFFENNEERPNQEGRSIVRANLGDHVVKRSAHINEYGEVSGQYCYSLTKEALQEFRSINEQKEQHNG